jgi:hydroxyacylglutathione hydrolase
MANSLGKLGALPPDTLVCCAHEYTVANLRWALEVEPDNTALQEKWQAANKLREQGLPTLPSTIQAELDFNPFLRTAQEGVAQAAAGYAGTALSTDTEIFASLREWKNNFK